MDEQAGTGRSRRQRPATRKDVAERAGVSPATVSMVLGDRAGEYRISPDTCRRVEAAARELAYHRSVHASALQGRPSRVCGMVTAADITDAPPLGPGAAPARVFLGAVYAARLAGWHLQLAGGDGDWGEDLETALAEQRAGRFDALLVDARGRAPAELALLAAAGDAPILLLGGAAQGLQSIEPPAVDGDCWQQNQAWEQLGARGFELLCERCGCGHG